MRLSAVLLFTTSIGMIALACGGASDQDVLTQSSSSSSSSSTSSGTTTASSSGTTASGSSGTTASGSSGTTTSSGSTGSSSGGIKSGKCTQETELNNEPGTANELVDSVCGTLLPATELDYLTFKLPENAQSMSLTFEGDVKLRISVEGQNQVELSPTSNPPVPFAPGKDYIIRVSANTAGAVKVDWRVNLEHT